MPCFKSKSSIPNSTPIIFKSNLRESSCLRESSKMNLSLPQKYPLSPAQCALLLVPKASAVGSVLLACPESFPALRTIHGTGIERGSPRQRVFSLIGLRLLMALRFFLVVVIQHTIFWPFGVFILAAFDSPHE